MSPEGAWSATWRQPDEDLRLTLTVPAGCMQEVILADGEPECAPGNPPTIQYVLGRNVLPDEQIAAGQELSSQYVAVIEPHRGAAAVTAVEPLELVGNGRRGFRISDFGFRISEPGVQTIDNQQSTIGNRQSAIGRRAVPSAEAVGLAVQRGRVTDLIHSSLSSTEPCEWRGGDQPFVVTGEFALVTVDDEGVQRACLVNGTSLRYGDFVLKADPSPAGKVINVDPQRNAITIDTALAAPEACRDAVVILGNELHQTSYTIQEARVADGGTTLYFGDVLFVIGVGEVAQTDQTAPKVVAAAALSGYGRIDGGRHAGRWLYNEDKSRGFRIAAVAGSEIQLEGVDGDLEAIFRDADGDSRRQYWISDIGPGDTFRIPTTTYWERVRPGE
jgi:hypothetical protein